MPYRHSDEHDQNASENRQDDSPRRRPVEPGAQFLEMQVADEPDDRDAERYHQHQENDPAFAPFFPQRLSPAVRSSFIAPASVLERDRNIQPAPAFARPGQQLFPLPPRRFLRPSPRLRDHPHEYFQFSPQSRIPL